ncbi:MAG: CBS domain-containing protein [Eubacteriales bacterium]
MEIITTHNKTDLDAFASMVAAQKIYPMALPVFSGKHSPNVEEFISLHKDILNFYTVKDIDLSKISRVIVVDTKNPRRLDRLADVLRRPGVEIHIYDHHPWVSGDLHGDLEVVEMVGATTTLLIEKIRRQGVPITALEATILALGIYEDTGSLTFTSTTARDVLAVAFLLEKGANLGVVAGFLGRPLTHEQKNLLKKLLLSADHHQVNGFNILIYNADMPEFIIGLDILTHTLSKIEQPDAIFTVVKMEDRVYVVGRSNVAQVNVGEILSCLGGGGHEGAASAVLKGAEISEVLEKLLAVVRERVHPPLTCRGIMSSPVKTVGLDTPISEAGQVMLRYGHSGLPVVSEKQLLGVISRRDVEKAIHHGLGHAPVKGFMTNRLISVHPDMPVSEVRELMIEHDIGRVPVVEGGFLVGIVSRSDVLQTLHGKMPSQYQVIYSSPLTAHPVNLKGFLDVFLPTFIRELLYKSGELGNKLGCRVYAAGGVVRDILLKAANLDVDLVVEGDGIALAYSLGEFYGVRVRAHRQFGTAQLVFSGDFKVDVATARVEYYEYPAALPKVESSSLHQDLYRRDFTINAMAMSLDEGRFGDLIDFFGGRQDLQDGQIRVLYNLSFIEDPTRILRAVRFEQRYNFSIESQTLRFLKEAVDQQVLKKLSWERIWEELKHILSEPRSGEMLARLDNLQVWPFVFPEVSYREVEPALKNIGYSLRKLQEWDVYFPSKRWLCCLIAVMHRLSPEAARIICNRYHFKKRQTDNVIASITGYPAILSGVRDSYNKESIGELAKLILEIPRESYPLLVVLADGEKMRDRLRCLLEFVLKSRPSIDGKFIKSLGCRPGPIFRRTIDAVWQARLEGRVKSREDEEAFVRQYLNQ